MQAQVMLTLTACRPGSHGSACQAGWSSPAESDGPISCCWMIVIVRRRPVVVIRVIVPDVFVDVQRRRHGRRDQGLNEHECHDPAHGGSALRLPGRSETRVSAGW